MAKRTREQLVAAISREIRLSQVRTDAFDDAVSQALGLNRSDHRAVDVLEQDGPMTAGRLAAAIGLSTAAVTSVIDRLERAGYARRRRDERDRRRVVVEVTEKVHREAGRHYGPLAVTAEKLYERFTDEELEVVLRFLLAGAELFGPLLDELRARLDRGG